MPKKLLLVDDSPFIRDFIKEMLSSEPEIIIAGNAENGKEACEMAGTLKPDLILMDIHMPLMDGIKATEWIMEHHPTPVIIVTNDDSRAVAMKAIEVGAIEIILKPTIHDIEDEKAREAFIDNIRKMSRLKVKRTSPKKEGTSVKKPEQKAYTAPLIKKSPYQIIAIAASTGGPKVLYEILPLIEGVPLPIIVTQHLNKDFSDQFIGWLEQRTARTTRFAVDGEKLSSDTILFAPPDIHLTVNPSGIAVYSDAPKQNYQKPSADIMFHSVAKAYGKKGLGIILTGMGRDGALGILEMHKAGGHTIAQDKESSVVFGMPGEAVRLNAAHDILPYMQIPERVKELTQ